MKKTMVFFITLAMCFSMFASATSEQATSKTEVEIALAAAEKMSNEELYEKAKTEAGTMKVYSTTSLCGTAVTKFMEAYPELKVEYSSVSETDMFTKLSTEIDSAAEGADMALLQNAYLLQSQLIDENLVVNYFPQMYKDTVDEKYQNPTAILMVSKLFMYNNTAGDIGLKNIWQLTEEQYKGKIFFKDPNTEPVGMNFLVMLTSPEWTTKIAEAYKDYYGKEWSSDTFKSASYQWIDNFLANCSFEYTADGGICTGLTNGAAGNVGLFVFSKLRGNEAARKNLSVAHGMNAFVGFMYPTYAQICKDTDMPYTCALFINWIMSNEGSYPWTNDGVMGNYSTNSAIPLADATGLDSDVNYWLGCTVVEDGEYLASAYAEVFDFISVRIK